MVDFDKLRAKTPKAQAVDPMEIFRRLPKPPGINDLYTSQAEVLQTWYGRRGERDTVVKLHTGGGKTLVGLLMAQSSLIELREPVLYLVPNTQLVKQATERAKAYGIPVVPYERLKPLNDAFVNATAIMVATYAAFFHAKSYFGVRGGPRPPQKVGALIVDDAHAAFSEVRDRFTLSVESGEGTGRERYEALCGLFRRAFKEIDRQGTFDEVVAGKERAVLEVPYWAWHQQLDAVRQHLAGDSEAHALVWPLIRDRLHLCHALVSRRAFTITPILPLVDAFPTLVEASRRVYMSATLADDSELVRTFDVDPKAVQDALTSRSLAGISERMVLVPNLMPFRFEPLAGIRKLLKATVDKRLGAVILVPSNQAATAWVDVAEVAEGPDRAAALVKRLQDGETCGPAVLSNRYDGIDLPGDACRLLVIHGLPQGTSEYEQYRMGALYGGASIVRMLAQRLEQGMGRGARGSGDHCVVVLAGADLEGWVAKEANLRFLTSATRTQLDMGVSISAEITSAKDLLATIKRSFAREGSWIHYHAETLANGLDQASPDVSRIQQASTERKALNLWRDGYHEKAISKIEKQLADEGQDAQTRGWLLQLAARVADHWGNKERAEDLQRDAYGNNWNLLRPISRPPYRALPKPGAQEVAIAKQVGGYRLRRGMLASFEEAVSHLTPHAASSQFELALEDLGRMLGLTSQRLASRGDGPDVLWLLPNREGWVIEAKNRKKEHGALSKGEHGQLLVAGEWFKREYSEYRCLRVSVLGSSVSRPDASAEGSYALTFDKLAELVSDTRVLLTALVESQLSDTELVTEGGRLLGVSGLHADRLATAYLKSFTK